MGNDILSMNTDEIANSLSEFKAPRYAAGRIFDWLHNKKARSFQQITDLSLELRKQLKDKFIIPLTNILEEQKSKDGTQKFLIGLGDGMEIETVLLSEGRRKTQCVSTQVGCPLGCSFCATARLGFKRNLGAGEIISQVEDICINYSRPSNLVFMGMGEPFLNYNNLIKAIRILNDSSGLNIGARKMTVSTAGIPEGIRCLAGENLQVRLAFSLNAADEKKRSRLMPVNNKYPLKDVIEALNYYISKTGRRVTFEYVLVPNINDYDKDLELLINLAGEMKVNVNLIEMNPCSNKMEKNQIPDLAMKWRDSLIGSGIDTAIRFRRGLDINAGCGQLALKRKND